MRVPPRCVPAHARVPPDRHHLGNALCLPAKASRTRRFLSRRSPTRECAPCVGNVVGVESIGKHHVAATRDGVAWRHLLPRRKAGAHVLSTRPGCTDWLKSRRTFLAKRWNRYAHFRVSCCGECLHKKKPMVWREFLGSLLARFAYPPPSDEGLVMSAAKLRTTHQTAGIIASCSRISPQVRLIRDGAPTNPGPLP